jgi:hypothetical protein
VKEIDEKLVRSDLGFQSVHFIMRLYKIMEF